jgi:beta-N-acetylhexosaminidase
LTGKAQLARAHGELIARGVKAFGFNTTLAPVIDLALPDSAEVMGTRAAAPDAAGVIAYARPFLAGLASHGIAGCAKHFPGLGAGTRDSHLETPAIDRPWNVLWRDYLAPYRELRNDLPMVMVNHAAYPHTHSKGLPASISSYWITNVLRKQIGYRGLIFSDDMEMGGILKFQSIEEASVSALRAGMDTLEICHSPEVILRAFEALIAEGERSPAFCKLLLERSRTTQRKRTRLFTGASERALTTRQFDALRNGILHFRDQINKIVPDPAVGSIHAPRTQTLAETA